MVAKIRDEYLELFRQAAAKGDPVVGESKQSMKDDHRKPLSEAAKE